MGFRSIIQTRVRAAIKSFGGPDFETLESNLAKATGRASDGVLDQRDIDALVDASGAPLSRTVKSEMMKQIDGDGDRKITSPEWALRPR